MCFKHQNVLLEMSNKRSKPLQSHNDNLKHFSNWHLNHLADNGTLCLKETMTKMCAIICMNIITHAHTQTQEVEIRFKKTKQLLHLLNKHHLINPTPTETGGTGCNVAIVYSFNKIHCDVSKKDVRLRSWIGMKPVIHRRNSLKERQTIVQIQPRYT